MNNKKLTTRNAAKLAPNRFPGFLLGFLLLAIGILAVGCSGRPSRVPVTGKVTIDGEPLEFGSITFYASAGGRPGGGTLAEGGTYSVTMYEMNDGLPLGEYLVSVTAANWISDRACRWHAPKRYEDAKTSELTAEITSDGNPMNFDLTWEGDSHGKPWVQKY